MGLELKLQHVRDPVVFENINSQGSMKKKAARFSLQFEAPRAIAHMGNDEFTRWILTEIQMQDLRISTFKQ